VPRHPPNALTSLTTRKRCFSPLVLTHVPRVAPVGGQVITRLHIAFAVSERGSRPDHVSHTKTLVDFVVELALSELGTLRVARSSICACWRKSDQFRASHFVQLFSCHPTRPDSVVGVGQERFELSTPRLSSVCSNQLSYWPVGLIGLSRPNSNPWR
jgi:hypothetical protein